jgi:hypothetical protein
MHLELSYIHRFVEKTSDGDDWAIRKTAIYQRFNEYDQTSFWIFVESRSTFQSIQKTMGDSSVAHEGSQNPLLIHLQLLMATSDNWFEYIIALASELHKIVRNSCILLG